MFEVLGYVNRLSVRPGETITFMTSTRAAHYDLRFVRLVDGFHQPLNHCSEVLVPSPIDGRREGVHQPIATGSYLLVPDDARLRLGRSFTLAAWICPTTPRAGRRQSILSKRAGDGEGGYELALMAEGDLGLSFDAADGSTTELRTGDPLRPSEWYFVAGVHDMGARRVALVQRPLSRWLDAASVQAREARVTPKQSRAPLLVAASGSDPQPGRIPGAYNGKIEAPQVWRVALADAELAALESGVPQQGLRPGLVAAWAFGVDAHSATVRDRGPYGLHAQAVNCPARAVTGHSWTGEVTDFRDAPEQYDAIHFHEDDLADAGWEPTAALTVPREWPSGVYAARLESCGGVDYVPFIVGPGIRSRSKVAVVLPTLTYLAYGNRRFDDRVRTMLAAFGRGRHVPLSPHERYVAEHPELGLSLYDRHAGDDLCAYASRLRPIAEMRPDYYHWITSTARHFSADLHLLGWLESRGYRYDVLADEDLHTEGVAAVRDYDVLVTGSHPEYATAEMRRGLEDYVGSGGNLMYLGGNGFYWVASLDPERPYLMEVRRGHAGTGEGYSAPGECRHSTTGEPGGLWRLRGKPPQTLVGVGFSGQGWLDAAPYRACPDSQDSRAAFVLEGVATDRPIGAFGPMGGAAGDEVDRADEALGTPSCALVIASSCGLHSDAYQGAIEDASCLTPRSGGTASDAVRADIVLAEVPDGGAVFSVGSIAWCLSLAHNGGDNDVARITANVLEGLLARSRVGPSERQESVRRVRPEAPPPRHRASDRRRPPNG